MKFKYNVNFYFQLFHVMFLNLNKSSLEDLITFDIFVAVYYHLRLMSLHKNRMKKVNIKPIYILCIFRDIV